MPGFGVHDHRIRCSAWPDRAFMMAGFGVQHPPASAFTFNRIGCSEWSGFRSNYA
jgi:hypothetical protein